MPSHRPKFILIITFIALAISGCSIASDDKYIGSVLERISPTYAGPAEKSYCSTITPYVGAATITGSATYTERALNGSGLGPESSSLNIRHAEIEITNSSGTRVQCAHVDTSGNFSFAVPISSSPLTLTIYSRANNSFVKTSILNMPEQNKLYSLKTNFTPDASKNIGTIHASAVGTNTIGAAFHILDLIVSVNDFLRAEVGSCSSTVDGCSDFTVADKVNIYWEPGFNPNSYFGSPNSGLSFYLPGFSRLFILGGINGDINSSDTDHFDDTIIVHEYGHFLEDIYSVSDSPGGVHAGKDPIDPRLALSEAWGNFLQAAVNYGAASTDPRYTDTFGNVDGLSTNYLLNIPLEQKSPGCTTSTPGCDQPTQPGEGNFREFALSRALWDVYDTNDDAETISGGFQEVWASITNGNGYLTDTDSKFRSAGLMYQIQNSLTQSAVGPISDWSTVWNQTENLQQNDRTHYAQKVTATGVCPTRNFNIIPINEFTDTHEFSTSNLFDNNDFYHYEHITSGPANFTLNYLSSGINEADLDLFIYNESAVFGSSLDIVAKNNSFKSTSTTDLETANVNIAHLSAGHYLINVKVKTHHTTTVGTSTDYEVLLGGTRLCP